MLYQAGRQAGITPLNRLKEYRKSERRKEKMEKKKNWAKKDGSLAPIIVPAKPNPTSR